MYGEGSTNTRTLEGTLHETISRLTECQQTLAVQRIVRDARRFLLILGSWESAPPPPAEQNEIIDEVMQLLKDSMTLPVDKPGPDPAPALKPKRKPRPKPVDDWPVINVEPASEPPPSSRPGTKPLARVPVRRQATLPGPEANTPRQAFAAGPGARVLRPHELAWQAVPARPGVLVKMLHQSAARGPCRALVRLEPGTELPSHRHGVAEDLCVLAGALQIGGEEAHAGDIIHAEPGATTGLLHSPGECTFLLVGSDRPGLVPRD